VAWYYGGKEGVEIMMGGRIASRTGMGSHPGAVFSFHARGLLKGPGHECTMKIWKDQRPSVSTIV